MTPYQLEQKARMERDERRWKRRRVEMVKRFHHAGSVGLIRQTMRAASPTPVVWESWQRQLYALADPARRFRLVKRGPLKSPVYKPVFTDPDVEMHFRLRYEGTQELPE